MTVLVFPKHRLEFWGEGKLAYCPTCGGAEGSLPEHCPQRRMTEDEEQAVMAGQLDYRRSEGGWTSFTRSKMLQIKRRLT